MLRLITAAGFLAITGTVWAQETAPLPTPESTSVPQQDAAPPPEPMKEPVAADAGSTKAMQVQQAVETNFPTYDTDQSGDLNAAEFGSWLVVLREKSAKAKGTADAMPEAEKQLWLNEAFTKADADSSKLISKAELETFLMG